jgi:ADP-L-glycero-D-manno-heptose 6-epimerase
MYIVTGGAGFIGSALLWRLNKDGIDNILVVDDLRSSEKWKNLRGKSFYDIVSKEGFLDQLERRAFGYKFSGIVHLGACSSTTESDGDYLLRNNVTFSKRLISFSVEHNIRLIYASSAATYGDGALGFNDETPSDHLFPLNRYGFSKQLVDIWVEKEILKKGIGEIAGLKFFNVYGPNEYHKGLMISVPYKAFHEVRRLGEVSLFKSYREDFIDGGQKRDFVYVKDCLDVITWLLKNKVIGIFNVASGEARSWNELAKAIFSALSVPPNIKYIEMPENLRLQYQYFTKGDITKLRVAGYNQDFTTLEDGVKDYCLNYLEKPQTHL